MIINPKKDCPHVENSKLIDVEEFRKIPFGELKCLKCDESHEIWICLICGERYCSRKINGHFVEHNKENPEHCLFLGTLDLSIWCFECIDDKHKDSNSEEKANEIEKGSYIESKKTNEYIKIIKFNFTEKKEICSHIKDENIINYYKNIFESGFENTIKRIDKFRDKVAFVGLCLICGEKIYNEDNLEEHYNENKHKLYINILN